MDPSIRVDLAWGQPGVDDPVYTISAAAHLTGLHAQTLRQYDRLGLVSPHRTSGGGRRYSARDVAMLREVQRLSQEEGVNLAGIRRILDLSRRLAATEERLAALVDALDAAHSGRVAFVADRTGVRRFGPEPGVRMDVHRMGSDVVLWQQQAVPARHR
jgi:MerR family transcriptional regulator/heat shock protein HspR